LEIVARLPASDTELYCVFIALADCAAHPDTCLQHGFARRANLD